MSGMPERCKKCELVGSIGCIACAKNFELSSLREELERAKEGIELQALICEREGMVAENMQRSHLGNSMAYTEDNFLILAEKIRRMKEAAK